MSAWVKNLQKHWEDSKADVAARVVDVDGTWTEATRTFEGFIRAQPVKVEGTCFETSN